MKVCVVGTGYVGLVTGACLAHIGHDVICIDNNSAKVELMKSGQSPIFEPGLEEILQSNLSAGCLSFSTDLQLGINHGDIIFIAVGTPSLPTGETNTSFVEAVATGIGNCLSSDYKVIVNKSTVPIGSGDWVKMLIMDGVCERTQIAISVGSSDADTSLDPDVSFDVVSNPEFLREGTAVFDTFNPDRIVLGSSSDRALDLMKKLYAPIIERKFAEEPHLPAVPVLETDLSSAEMIKYAANAFLATKISFINEVANICDRVGADVVEVAKGIGLDSRIGNKFLNAGIGWGGSCFPKDVSALVHTGDDYGYEAEILKAVIDVNRRQRLIVLEKLQSSLKVLKGKTIGLLGLTFKPNTDDMRDAPAIDLIAQLNRLGAKVKGYDPIILEKSHAFEKLEGIFIAKDPLALAQGCDALVLVTEWPQFQELDYRALRAVVTQNILIDSRNCLEPNHLKSLGFDYQGVGRR